MTFNPRRCAVILATTLLCFGAAAPARAVDISDVHVSLSPVEPAVGDRLVVHVTGQSSCAGAWFGSLAQTPPVPLVPQILRIEVLAAGSDWDCLATPLPPLDLDVPIGHLEAGAYGIEVWGQSITTNGDPEGAPILLAELPLAVDEIPRPSLLLHDGRFDVAVDWRLANGTGGSGHVVPGFSDESGLFYFFRPERWELLVKLLNGCAINGHYWALGAAATNVGYTVHMLDTATSRSWTHEHAAGSLAPAFADTRAFPCDD